MARTEITDPEIEALGQRIASLIEQVSLQTEGLSREHLNWKPPIPQGNSVYVIAEHILGNAAAWVLGIACGRPMRRDRPAEFAASGEAVALAAKAGRLSDAVSSGMATLSPDQMDRRLTPSPELWGEGEPHEISVREALLHVIEHASVHLGEMQITKDLLRAEHAR